MTRKELEREVIHFIAQKLEADEPVPVEWAATEILAKHKKIHGEDAPWYRFCAYELVYDTVNAVSRTYAGGADPGAGRVKAPRLRPPAAPGPTQPVFHGFEQLQLAYSVQRRICPKCKKPAAKVTDKLCRACEETYGLESVIVPIGKLSEDEIARKVAELRAMGAGCYEHADELERYGQMRFRP